MGSALLLAGSAMFLGLGLGRFAFSPLIPELVQSGLFDAATAQSIAAANLVGYFVGALIARKALQITGERRACISAGVVVVFSYAMLLLPFGWAWFWASRLLAGVGGALLMVIATAAAGRQLASIGRKHLQPLVFVGIGLGVLSVAVCLPQLIAQGLYAAILTLMVFSALSLALLWLSGGFLGAERKRETTNRISAPSLTAVLIVLAYGCDALGFVMHTVYLPDMLRRSYGHTEVEVATSWVCFGIGACLAPGFVLALRRYFNSFDALWLAYVLKAAGVGLVLFASDPIAASASLFIVGVLTPGLVMLTSGALSSFASPDRYLGLWAVATATFALFQMISGTAISAISAEGYETALIVSVTVLVLGAVLSLLAKCVSRAEYP